VNKELLDEIILMASLCESKEAQHLLLKTALFVNQHQKESLGFHQQMKNWINGILIKKRSHA
jgi:hypothetical protein